MTTQREESVVRDRATVTVLRPVDGTVRRRKPRKGQRRAVTTHHVKVDPRVWAVAKRLCGPYQSIVIVDSETVRVVNG